MKEEKPLVLKVGDVVARRPDFATWHYALEAPRKGVVVKIHKRGHTVAFKKSDGTTENVVVSCQSDLSLWTEEHDQKVRRSSLFERMDNVLYTFGRDRRVLFDTFDPAEFESVLPVLEATAKKVTVGIKRKEEEGRVRREESDARRAREEAVHAAHRGKGGS